MLDAYENLDTSNQSLKFESPYFPANFRLLKWKVLDICVASVQNNGSIGYFSLFEHLFPPGKLMEAVEKIIGEVPNYTTLPLYQQIRDDEELDEKAKKQAETYLRVSHEHKYKLQKRRYAEYFLNKILFNEEGLRIADKIMFLKARQVHMTAHWTDLPAGWLSGETFKQRFYDEEEVQSNPYGLQRLDRVANAARGMIILSRFKANATCKNEYNLLCRETDDPQNLCQTKLVTELLDDGPMYDLKVVDGEEKLSVATKWDVHKTLLIFFYVPGFSTKSPKEQDDWYYGLLDAMKNDPSNRAALFFLNNRYAEELYEREQEMERQRLLERKGMISDEICVGEEIFTKIRPQKVDLSLNPDSSSPAELSLRNYQEELVQPALEGKNSVIVAPTGSGKTEVAIYAALNHIRGRHSEGRAARVVMLVPKIPLVDQQKKRFLQYCGGRYSVNGFHGSEKSDNNEGRRDDVLESHVVVMTPQILINMLESVRQSERLYVSDFSMMIFDEVHKTTGNHPYVVINQLVQQWPHEKPQIVGLTASLSVSASGQNEMTQMMNGIFKMLALLNTPHLSTIRNEANLETLNSYVGKPDDTIEVCHPKECKLREYLDRCLREMHNKLVEELEKLSKSRHNAFPSNSYRKFRQTTTEKYEYYESLLIQIVQELNKLNTPDKFKAQTWARYIRIYVEARGIVDLMPAVDAFKYMESELLKLDPKRDESNEFSHFLTKHYDGLKKESRDEEPPIVIKLKDTLATQFETKPDSRVIIFVTQRTTAERVSNFLNRSGILERFRTDGYEDLIGYVLGTNKQGPVQQSQQEQQANLAKFNNGHMKVMVATSVVEEGLDVAACNLIIKYNCSSGSAIQLIQQRGRGRAKNSRSVLLSVSSKVNERENTAILSEKLMRACVKKIEEDGHKQLAQEVQQALEQIKRERERELAEERERQKQYEQDFYHLGCANCSAGLCKSTDVKKVYSNYMCFNPTIWDRVLVESKRKTSKYLSAETQALSILKCAGCKTAIIGKAYKMRGVYLPQLDCKAITFQSESTTEGKSAKKWTSVESEFFWIGQAHQADFENMLNALSTSPSNMDKKRLLDLDSKQHIKDIEMKKYRDKDEMKDWEAEEHAKRVKQQEEGDEDEEEEED
uniref:RNA helicase n=1 Tax=Caenorhabditis tropicalis TaxID=1561998 RepID=A0A1I7T930_9PELO